MTERHLDLGWMRVFDAVARLGGITAASQTLGLSQPTVSYQIRKLEEAVGAPLLTRLHRGTSLSAEGETLFAAVSDALQRVDRATDAIRSRAARPIIRLHTDYAFSGFWLIPRMHRFRALHPETEIHVIAAQGRPRALPSAEAAVMFGTRKDFGPDAICLFHEEVTPVAAPDHLKRTGTRDLSQLPLIHLQSDGTEASSWLEWDGYLAAQRIARTSGGHGADLQLNTYSLVVQAAQRGQGVALGWQGLIDDHLSAGTLLPVGATVTNKARGYWLVPPSEGVLEARQMVDWMLSERSEMLGRLGPEH